MRYEVSTSWLGDEQQVWYVYDKEQKRITHPLFYNQRDAAEECSRMNSKEGSGINA